MKRDSASEYAVVPLSTYAVVRILDDPPHPPPVAYVLN